MPVHCLTNLPLRSKIWILLFSRSATYTRSPSITIECGVSNCPSPEPSIIHRPNIVVCIDSHRVWYEEEIIGNAADEFSSFVELHQGMLSTMKHIDVTL